jgi:hypothetical protein
LTEPHNVREFDDLAGQVTIRPLEKTATGTPVAGFTTFCSRTGTAAACPTAPDATILRAAVADISCRDRGRSRIFGRTP